VATYFSNIFAACDDDDDGDGESTTSVLYAATETATFPAAAASLCFVFAQALFNLHDGDDAAADLAFKWKKLCRTHTHKGIHIHKGNDRTAPHRVTTTTALEAE